MAEQLNIHIGTSGWSYPKGEGTWNGHFYPRGKINELEYYSQFFDTVEINSTFYRPPNPGYAYNWAKRVPEGFLFTVKLWQKFTHPKMYESATGEVAVISPDDVDTFRRGIEPLAKYGKLGAMLAQFPPSFKNEPVNKQLLSAVVRTFGDYGLAVELRHHSWSDDKETAQILRDSNIAWVQIDEPKFKTSIARDLPATADMVYFRFHGYNADKWWSGNNETRYQYLYSPDEIDELAARVRVSTEGAQIAFLMFNNHWQGYAPRNAMDLKKALQMSFTE
jgi:uncharacterized protein YecE (DUF72 family)